MKVIIVNDTNELGREALAQILKVVKQNPSATLGLATGSTPLPLYNAIIADHKENGTSYKNIKTFNLDEYVGLDSSHPQSYIKFMRDNLFDHIDIDLKNVNIPNGLSDNIPNECKRYSTLLSKSSVDIQILGIGSNGHIAFNEPNTPFDSLTHQVKLTQKTICDNARFFNNINEVPTSALTMGIGEIMRAKTILMLATGAGKANAVYEMIKGKVDVSCPASVLQNHKNTIVIIDKAAASKL
ncbi:MAG: glucosamine-6-phosphate deaminase [Clostridia bacterium]